MNSLKDALAPLYRWIRDTYGLDAGPVIVRVGQYRLEVPPITTACTQHQESKDLTSIQREVMTYLLTGPKTLDAISAKTGYDRSGLHRRHLKPLMASGLVSKSKDGYVLTPAGRAEADSFENAK